MQRRATLKPFLILAGLTLACLAGLSLTIDVIFDRPIGSVLLIVVLPFGLSLVATAITQRKFLDLKAWTDHRPSRFEAVAFAAIGAAGIAMANADATPRAIGGALGAGALLAIAGMLLVAIIRER